MRQRVVFAFLAAVASLLVSCGAAPVGPRARAVAVPPAIVARYVAGGDSRDDHARVIPWAFEQAKARGAAAFFFLGDMELTPSFDSGFARELMR